MTSKEYFLQPIRFYMQGAFGPDGMRGPNKKIPVFPYLNLMVKPIFFQIYFFRFSEKIYNFKHFERLNAFQNA